MAASRPPRPQEGARRTLTPNRDWSTFVLFYVQVQEHCCETGCRLRLMSSPCVPAPPEKNPLQHSKELLYQHTLQKAKEVWVLFPLT